MFKNRIEAGRSLGARLSEFVSEKDVLVLALPRGGVPVGFEVARALNAPLDVFLVRKLGVPGREELAMGAIASGGVRLIDAETVRALDVSAEEVEEATRRETRELERRERLYRGDREALDAHRRTVILVDDGMATGLSMRAAIATLRQERSQRIVVAVPIAARTTCAELESVADAVVCLYTPMEFFAVGQWYSDFSQTSDEEVRGLLDRATRASARVA